MILETGASLIERQNVSAIRHFLSLTRIELETKTRVSATMYNMRYIDAVSSTCMTDRLSLCTEIIGKKGGKDQETIQSSTTPDPGYHMGK